MTEPLPSCRMYQSACKGLGPTRRRQFLLVCDTNVLSESRGGGGRRGGQMQCHLSVAGHPAPSAAESRQGGWQTDQCVADDVQWAGPDSVQVFGFVAPRPAAEMFCHVIFSLAGRAESHRSHEICDFAAGMWYRIGAHRTCGSVSTTRCCVPADEEPQDVVVRGWYRIPDSR